MSTLWEHGIPYGDSDLTEFEPDITYYPCDGAQGAVVVCAGGGYGFRAPHEGPEIAKWLNENQVAAFVLDYRVEPYKHPAPLSDGLRAVRYARYHAKEYGIDPHKIAIMGFSAGGHLAASVSVHYNKDVYEVTDEIDTMDARPDASILCYPVIDLGEYRHDGSRINLLGENPPRAMKDFLSLHKQITKDTPQAFLWHTSSDQAVPVENSMLYAQALSDVQVPFEMHLYPVGRHGLGLAAEEPHVAQWADSLKKWLTLTGFRK